MANTEGLIKELERIKEVVASAEGHHRNVFVCTTVTGPYKQTVKRMVCRHIRNSNITMNIFLNANGVARPFDPKVANAYRILMLDSMIEMVKKGDYK